MVGDYGAGIHLTVPDWGNFSRITTRVIKIVIKLSSSSRVYTQQVLHFLLMQSPLVPYLQRDPKRVPVTFGLCIRSAPVVWDTMSNKPVINLSLEYS
jgi:hypothetical protein